MKYLVLSVALLLPITMVAAPSIPHQLYGSVQNTTSGTLKALIDGGVVASTTLTDEGTFGYSPFFFIEDEGGVFEGKTISFLINNEEIEQTLTFVQGGLTQLTLTKKISGGGTGGNELPVAPPTVSAPPSPSNPFDPTGDGIVDINDFNYFMANWGSSETDFNGDGVVDVQDFNILMSNWS